MKTLICFQIFGGKINTKAKVENQSVLKILTILFYCMRLENVNDHKLKTLHLEQGRPYRN